MEVVEEQMEHTEIEVGIHRRKKTWLVTINLSVDSSCRITQTERERER